MDILVVRHGESEGNRDGRLQGQADPPLTARGRAQAAKLGGWLASRGLRWSTAYASPLQRAAATAEILASVTTFPKASNDEDLREIGAGSIEGLTRDEIARQHPDFLARSVAGLGDFSEYGGESYAEVQERVARVRGRIEERHRAPADTVLLVAHGGFNFQFVKAAICVPVPRVCILQWGNCTATLLRFRERRGVYMAEVSWHVPLELTGGESGEESTRVFR